MKKRIAALVCVILTLAFAQAAQAAGSITLSGSCNVRSGPGAGYSTLGTVSGGSSLAATQETRVDAGGVVWYEVSFNGGTGWICADYAQGGAAARDTARQRSDYCDGCSGGSDCGWQGITGSCKVRSGPGLGYDVIDCAQDAAAIAFDDVVRYDSCGVAWYRVWYNAHTGWVSASGAMVY